jgi:hypothetical protein
MPWTIRQENGEPITALAKEFDKGMDDVSRQARAEFFLYEQSA